MKILVVGLNPSRKHGKSPTLKVLNEWLNELRIPIVSFINIYDGYDIVGSACQIDFIKSIAPRYDAILALGSAASDHLARVDVHHFKLPHPSGLNRQMNDKKYVHDQLESCKNYLRGDL